jgi:hypothetical protein
VVAAAIENVNKQDPGSVVFFDIDGNLLNSVTVGALPDMLTFTPDGKKVLVANEGESLDYCQGGTENDPEGSVSIIDLKDGAGELTQDDVTNVGFSACNDDDLDPSIMVFGPNATVAQDFEPEYIAVSANSKKAWVTLQENNAIAVIDIRDAEVTKLIDLGFKDHGLSGSGIDASDRDGAVNIDNWPVNGIYMPDAIDAVKVGGKEYLVTANEGDAREYDCFAEEERVKDLDLDPTAFPDAGELQEDGNIGRLTVTATLSDNDDDGTYEELYALGTRSFSIWNEKGKLVFDSGEDFEEITADAFPDFFNADNEENGQDTFDSRSDNKGPEPEALVVGGVKGKTFAFVGLERISGVMVYDISKPQEPEFVQYFNNRNFTASIESPEAGDLGPEGMIFIDKNDSPVNKHLLVVSNEISGTTTIYEVKVIG